MAYELQASGTRGSYPAPVYLAIFAITLASGVIGQSAGCASIRIPVFWIPLLGACYYLAILIAAVGFGPWMGLGAALLAGILHVTVGMKACGESIWQQGEVAPFIVVGVLAGFLSKKRQTSPASPLVETTPSSRELPAISQRPDGDFGQIGVGFVQSMRAPLSAIESAGYVLEDTPLTDQNRKEVATIILRECHRLDVLLRPLEYVPARLPLYREVEVSSILEQVVQRSQPLMESFSVSLRRSRGCHLLLTCDSELLEQAAWNLLANAVRFLSPGEELVLSAHQMRNRAVIEISHRQLGVLGQLGMAMATGSRLAARPEAGEIGLKPEVRIE